MLYITSASPKGAEFITPSENELIWLGRWFSNWLRVRISLGAFFKKTTVQPLLTESEPLICEA